MGAIETPHDMKLAWTPGPGFERGDGVNVAVGRKGTYHWVIRDGLHAAYHYPAAVQARKPRNSTPFRPAMATPPARRSGHAGRP